jgi:scyllo-inositol 2-dehydrogenase (NADP+)
MKKIINTAIVGFGLSGKVFHAPFIHLHPGFHLSKVVERHKEESKEIYPEVEVVKEYMDLLRDDSIDLIIICTPNTLHNEMAREALNAGKHIVIEKPFTPTYAEANELISLAETVDKKIFVYQNRRWDGDFLTIEKLIHSGILGEIEWYEAHFDRYRPEMEAGKWRDEPLPGGGILYDLGSHLIDQVLHLFGLPASIKAEIEMQRKGSPVDDFFKIELEYQGMKVLLTAGMNVKELGPRFIVHGNRGSYIKYGIDPQEEKLRSGALPQGENWGTENEKNWGYLTMEDEHVEFDGQIETRPGRYQSFYENVFDVIINQSEMQINPKEGADVIRIIELAFKSASLGEAVKL